MENKKIDIERKHFPEIVINSIKNNDKINIEIVNYLNTINYYIRELLDYINKNYSDHDNYKDLVICIIRLHPNLIKKIDIERRDFSEIVINSIKNNDKINIEIVNYLNNLKDYISVFLNYINIIHSDHENYKDLVICIIRLNPELIKTINKDHKDYLNIVINSINVDNENNCEIVNYIINNDSHDYFTNFKNLLLLDKLKKEYIKHPNYSKLVKCILNKKIIFFKKILSTNLDEISKSS